MQWYFRKLSFPATGGMNSWKTSEGVIAIMQTCKGALPSNFKENGKEGRKQDILKMESTE